MIGSRLRVVRGGPVDPLVYHGGAWGTYVLAAPFLQIGQNGLSRMFSQEGCPAHVPPLPIGGARGVTGAAYDRLGVRRG